MDAAEIWSELGTLPTRDAAAIRRAYAIRLKSSRPDQDPQGFARLRDAYERALGMTAAPVAASMTPASAEPPPPPPRQAAPAASEPDILAECLKRGDLLAGVDWLIAAREAGTLSLQQDMCLTDRLGWTMAQDRALSAEAVRAAVDRLGWSPRPMPGQWAGALRARLEAEQWLASLRRDAASWTVWVGSARAIAARTMLGRGKLHGLPVTRRGSALTSRYGEFLLHAPIVGGQFDDARVQSVRRRVSQSLGKTASVVLVILIAVVAARAVGSAAGAIDPRFQDPTAGITAIGVILSVYRPRWTRRLLRRRKRP